MQTAHLIDGSDRQSPAAGAHKSLSALRFFLRYPIFLLAFGPPEFKPPIVGVDTSQAHFDAWNVIQVAWLSVIALRAMLFLAGGRPTRITRQIRSVLRLAFVLGLLFLASVAYSPGRVISAEYCLLYFLNLACIAEFISDAYSDPPDWMQCVFQLRLVSILLTVTVLLTSVVTPNLVIQGGGRLMGGSSSSHRLIASFIPWNRECDLRFSSSWVSGVRWPRKQEGLSSASPPF